MTVRLTERQREINAVDYLCANKEVSFLVETREKKFATLKIRMKQKRMDLVFH